MNLNLNILKTVILRKWIQSPLLPIVLVFIIAVGVATFFSVRLANKSAVSGFKLFTESLTGESDPQKRTWKKSDDIPLEAHCLTFFGTLVYSGSGKGLVIAIGDDTFMGQTASLASGTGQEDTPIAKEIKDFVFKVSGIAFALGISFFIIGMY